MAKGFPWTCPFCNRATTITKENYSSGLPIFNDGNRDGLLGIRWRAITCPNPECREYQITAFLYKAIYNPELTETGDPLMKWNLRPLSNAKPFPNYIPVAVLSDYNEACLIRDLSPKASATLSRRALQGIIRDFWGIRRNRLIDEINDVKNKVDLDTWKAIDAIRSIGNIGAHMEKDINLIVDVEPDEAQLLIELIETLFKDWYISRHDREEHMAGIVKLAEGKNHQKKSGKPSA
jgi:hypothetical protein